MIFFCVFAFSLPACSRPDFRSRCIAFPFRSDKNPRPSDFLHMACIAQFGYLKKTLAGKNPRSSKIIDLKPSWKPLGMRHFEKILDLRPSPKTLPKKPSQNALHLLCIALRGFFLRSEKNPRPSHRMQKKQASESVDDSQVWRNSHFHKSAKLYSCFALKSYVRLKWKEQIFSQTYDLSRCTT